MLRFATLRRLIFALLAMTCIAAAWSGCAAGDSEDKTTSGTGGSTLSLSSSSTGAGATGGIGVSVGGGGSGGGEACKTTNEKAGPVPVDLVVVLDQSGSMEGQKWTGTKNALSSFFNDPASAGISAGIVYFPTGKPYADPFPPPPDAQPYSCDETYYKLLDVPLAPLPDNAFPLTNSMPAHAEGFGTPTLAALNGAAFAACAYQDAHPTHKVNIVLATDGGPCCPIGSPGTFGVDYICEDTDIDPIAALAKGALEYNGVHTYVIGVEGSVMSQLNKIAASGGTTAAYDVTQDIAQFAATMAEIRTAALACEFSIPDPPEGMGLVPDEVNFTYTPGGMGMPVTLPRADNLADCGDKPGWYYDSNSDPTKILLCPASCNTVQNDLSAEVNVAFGCQSVLN